MDKYVGKRVSRGDSFSRRGAGIVFRDHNQEDRSLQNCSRLGCSSRVSSVRGSQIGRPEMPKHMRASFRSISGKAIAGSSSKPFSSSSSCRKSFQEQQDQTFLQESAVAGSSNSQQIDDMDSNDNQVPVGNLYSDGRKGRKGRKEDFVSIPMMTKSLKSPLFKGISADTTKSSNSSSGASSSKVYKKISGRLVSGNQESSSSSFIPGSTAAPRNPSYAAKSYSQSLRTREPRCGIKNLSFSSISDEFPSSYSSNLNGDRRIDMVRKRPSDGESSAATSRGSNASSSGSYSGSAHTETCVPILPIPGQIMHQPVSRRTRNRLTIRDGAISVRTQRTSGCRMRPSAEGDGSTPPLDESTMTPQLQQTQFSIPEAVRENSSRAFSMDVPHIFNNLYRRPNLSNHVARRRSVSHPEDGSTQIAHGSLGDRHGYQHFNMQGVAEVLLALERIEQDEELTYEQLIVLETNLLWGTLRFHDRHRDMRMDVDNMSYEELLALEEKMGTVSTALTEEQFSKCLKRSTYTCASLVPGILANDDVKCSICQEEYIVGDEVGRLPCEHRYHVACIHQWLRQKNWCPVCKSSALPSQDTTQS